MQLVELSTIVGGMGVKWKGSGCVGEKHLHVDLDGERHALLQLFGLLIEVLAKLSDGDSFLQKKKKKKF